MSSNDWSIRVNNLNKCYQIYNTSSDRLKQFVMPKLWQLIPGLKSFFASNYQTPTFYKEFWALKDISFEVKVGETVGIIGSNGSGKSTLLQMICGTLNPSSGSVETKGRIAALLELGTGFNPEFTGRENIFLNAALLGLSKTEIDDRFDDIAAFADLGQFLEQPVKTYSSGMVVKLAFAVQAQVEPDILIVDEALAVGDAKFQAKCFARLKQLKEKGTSILLVTHSSEQIVAHCSRAILLNKGVMLETGEPRYIVNCYLDLLFGKKGEPQQSSEDILIKSVSKQTSYSLNYSSDIFCTRPSYNPHEYRWGDGKAKILDFYLEADQKPYPSSILTGQLIKFVVSCQFLTNLLCPILGITIKTKEGLTVFGANTEMIGVSEFKELGKKGQVIQAEATFRCSLGAGDYFISLGIATRQGEEVIPHDRRYDAIHLQVLPCENFFGLVNLDFKLTTQEIS